MRCASAADTAQIFFSFSHSTSVTSASFCCSSMSTIIAAVSSLLRSSVGCSACRSACMRDTSFSVSSIESTPFAYRVSCVANTVRLVVSSEAKRRSNCR